MLENVFSIEFVPLQWGICQREQRKISIYSLRGTLSSSGETDNNKLPEK
jgi:hypothetical protein